MTLFIISQILFIQFISYYFDTNIGPKQSTDSYRLITEKVGSSATDIVFLTDVPKGWLLLSKECLFLIQCLINSIEAKAAKESGMMAILSERDGIFLTPDDKHTFNSITSFDKIIFLEF